VADEIAIRATRGRLLIRAPHPQLMLGYWNDLQRTAEQFIDADGARWFVTGDTVIADEDGYLFYLCGWLRESAPYVVHYIRRVMVSPGLC
jgi:acyl-coenzyme A synthetase/AMP-(fatty) acid ligase